jgi:hypothetical protein
VRTCEVGVKIIAVYLTLSGVIYVPLNSTQLSIRIIIYFAVMKIKESI